MAEITHQDWIEISDPDKLPKKPLVSVMMLAYNHEAYLAEAIEGVVAQQCDFPIELMIGEDCSKDKTRELALDYQKKYPHLIRVIYSDQNVGIHRNVRRIFLASKGKFTAYCEGDDYWHHPHKLEMQVRILRDRPDYGVVHTDFDHRIGNRVRRRILSLENQNIPKDNAFESLLRGNSTGTATTLYRSVAVRGFLDSKFAKVPYTFVDYARLLYSSLNWKFAYIPLSTATYQYRVGSAMNSGSVKSLKMRQSIIQCSKDFQHHSGHVPANKDDIDITNHRLLYGSAYLARAQDVFNEVSAWRKEHDPAFRRDWRHEARRRLMSIKALHNLVLWRANRQWWSKVKRNYVVMTLEEQTRMALNDQLDN